MHVLGPIWHKHFKARSFFKNISNSILSLDSTVTLSKQVKMNFTAFPKNQNKLL